MFLNYMEYTIQLIIVSNTRCWWGLKYIYIYINNHLNYPPLHALHDCSEAICVASTLCSRICASAMTRWRRLRAVCGGNDSLRMGRPEMVGVSKNRWGNLVNYIKADINLPIQEFHGHTMDWCDISDLPRWQWRRQRYWNI